MKKTLLLLVILLPVFLFAADKREKKELELQKTIQKLKKQYSGLQNDLQQLTEKRWAARQSQVETKEGHKEKLNQLQQQIERLYADVARAREEFLARQNVLEREKEVLQQKELERDFFIKAVIAKQEKEAEMNLAAFPVEQDVRMAALADIDRTYSGARHPTQKLEALFAYKNDFLRKSIELGIARRTFVPDDGSPVTAQVLRIGLCMAYAMSPDNDVYFLGNTGKLGTNQFVWRTVTNQDMTAALIALFPDMIKNHSLSGELPVDILQNTFSSSLVGGRPRTWKTSVCEFFVAGGPILFPLVLIVLWALILIVNRLVVYALKHRSSNRFINEAIALLSRGEIENARTLAQNRKGIHAQVLDTCLKHSQWKRSAAEKSIKELLLTEVPKLEKHLDTLAVLAAASPLLGLLGTVTGMIRMFEAITTFGTGDPKLLAGGISEALITTEVGLAIAIPLLLVHTFLRNRRNHIQADMEMYAMRILNRLWPEE